MKTDNELIAEFMGETLTEEDKAHDFTLEQLPYRTNWSWLMPVVEKIESVDGYSCIHIDHDSIFLHRKGDEMLYFKNKDEGSKIAALYKAVVEFVKWHNKVPA